MVNRYTVTRIASLEGKTLCFMVFLGSRERGWKRFEVDAVPSFEGEEAVFEADVRKGVWTFVRQVAVSGAQAELRLNRRSSPT